MTNARHVLHPLQQAKREVIVYAMELRERSGSPTQTNIGASPVWQMDNGGNDEVDGNIRIPRDRVPGTPIDIRLVFSVDAGGGEDNVLLNVDYLISGQGQLMTAAVQSIGLVVACAAANTSKTTDPMRIPSSVLDELLDISDIAFVVEREGANALDTSGADLHLYKVIWEYTAYV